MATPEIISPKYISLKNDDRFSEAWLEERLKAKPDLLGLGDELSVQNSQLIQPSGGRLDLLLVDRVTDVRYEVEIQLGAVDESHIIRTIEYWDNQRRRYPQYEHIAVIVAEYVTGRFLNVISLFNGTIPLIAIQLKGVEVQGAFTLIATRVLDLARLGTEEEEVGETVDRNYWEQNTSKDSMDIMDKLITLIKQIAPHVEPSYTKGYVGLRNGGKPDNFVTLAPRKRAFVVADFRVPQDDDLSAILDEASIKYDIKRERHQVWVYQNDLEHRAILTDLIKKSYEYTR